MPVDINLCSTQETGWVREDVNLDVREVVGVAAWRRRRGAARDLFFSRGWLLGPTSVGQIENRGFTNRGFTRIATG